MFETSLNKRYTYSKTIDFWDSIKKIESLYSEDSLDYTITKRDKIIFMLLYSYGLRPTEALNLSIFDFNFNEAENDIDSFGSIYIKSNNARLVDPIFPEVTKEIKNYLDIFNIFFKPSASSVFTTTKGNAITIPYLTSRLKLYNAKLPPSKRIDSLNTFRQYYIADLLRIKEFTQSFINNQIGNNILSNQVYLHLQPDKTQIGVIQ